MEWVKLSTSYHLDDALLRAGEPAEILFSRALAHAGLKETDGVITREALPRIVPARGRQRADALVREGLWSVIPGGWLINNWEKWQPTKAELDQWRASNRERQARWRTRHRSNGVRNGVSNADVTRTEQEVEVDAAAAAACELPPILDVFRGKLRRFTALSALRWDTLTADQTAELQRLVELHGDDRLVDVAVRTCRTPPPVHVSAFLGTWQSLPTAAERLRIVDEPKCPKHPHELARSCRGCAADDLAGDQP